MCGIVGAVSSEIDLTEVCHTISHRGPDDEGGFADKYLQLGHRRLSILDLSANGHQPMLSKDERYVIIFNGEIYNHLSIREELADKYAFKSTSDTETILYGYIEYGKALFNRLNGIFALAIYDKQTQDLIIVRDQFGIKPLYYYFKNNALYFASEIKALSNLTDLDKSIEQEAVLNYIQFLWSPGEKTPFKYVKKLLPGHYIDVNVRDLSTFSITKYYELTFDGSYSGKSENELIDELDEKLLRAVERQLLSDVPVGFFLSGGLDSSAIVAMARRLYPERKLQCYTIDTGSGGKSFEGFADDLPYAVKMARFLNADLQIVNAKVDIIKDFDKMIYHLDEPQADAAPLNVLNICRKAREDGYVVLLGGTAGDDLFSGYRRHQALYYENYFHILPQAVKLLMAQLVAPLKTKRPLTRRIRKLVQDIAEPELVRYSNFFSWLPTNTLHELVADEHKQYLNQYSPSKHLIESLKNIPEETSSLNKMLYWDLKYFLADHNLNYTDKMSMAVGVEVRVPFLDKELVEFSTKIPPELKMKGTTTKYLLRKVMERYLPQEIIYRPKSGFGAPVRQWITNELEELIGDYLSRESIQKRGLFKYEAVQQLITDNKKGYIDASYPIWALLAIESWMRQFVD